MKVRRNEMYAMAYNNAVIDAEKAAIGLGDDEIIVGFDRSDISIEESVVDIHMPGIGDLPARTIKVILASPRKPLEVMASIEQLTYLSMVAEYYIDHSIGWGIVQTVV